MPLIVSLHRLTSYNYISFLLVPCLWAQPKIPVKAPCGLFPRTFLVRSFSGGCTPGFSSFSLYQSAHSQALHHHCVTAKPSRLQRWPSSHSDLGLSGQLHLGTKHFLSPALYRSRCSQKNTFLQKQTNKKTPCFITWRCIGLKIKFHY